MSGILVLWNVIGGGATVDPALASVNPELLSTVAYHGVIKILGW